MSKEVTLKPGDACPNCDGELRRARIPTDTEYDKAFDRESTTALHPMADTAPPDQREELGELHRCGTCGYTTRFPAPKKKATVGAANT